MTIIARTKDYIKNKDLLGLYSFIINNQIDKETASEIFSLVYDHTNSFKNSNTCPNALNIAGKLMDMWVSNDKIVLEKTMKSLPRMKFIWEILGSINSHESGKIIWWITDIDLFSKYSETEESLDMVINEILFSVKNVEIVVFFIKNWEEIRNHIRFKDNNKNISIDMDSLKAVVS